VDMNIEQDVTNWLHTRLNWQQEVVARVLSKGSLSDDDLKELTEFAKTDEGKATSNNRSFHGLSAGASSQEELRLISIGEIKGIDNLNPRKPLTFGEANPVIVYGRNGTGKSGYIRIINKVSGKAHAVVLRPNVYSDTYEEQSCAIEYRIGKEDIPLIWTAADDPITDLKPIDVFDANRGRIYLDEENEISYSPRIVALFDDTDKAFQRIKIQLKTEKNSLVSQLPVLPLRHSGSSSGTLYNSLKAEHTKESLASILIWEDTDKNKLKELEERLNINDPAKLATTKRGQKTQLDNLIRDIDEAIIKLSIESCEEIKKLQKEARRNRTIAREGAEVTLKTAKLSGIGSETWRDLWNAAREYSQIEAYPERSFPVTSENSICVLCQQDLQEEGKQRLQQFESFVTGKLEKAANDSEELYDQTIKQLPRVPNDESLTTTIQAAGLDQDTWFPLLSVFYISVNAIVGELKGIGVHVTKHIIKDNITWLEQLRSQATVLEEQAKQHDQDARSSNLSDVINNKNELLAKQWTAQQAAAIITEIARLEKVAEYNGWIKATDTTAISIKAGDVAERVITSAYVDRFRSELIKFGAKKINVELVKTRASHGKALHAIRLRNVSTSSIKPKDILSDGERRVIELAAFIADVTSDINNSPIIFDDPISSLDQEYEEKFVERLVEISKVRQLIVFTHRLSLLGLLSDKSESGSVCIRQEPWGDGEPGGVPLFGKRPDRALKNILNERLKHAAYEYNNNGTDAYYPHAKSICTDFRILMERIVEYIFLADVVQRHRRDVKTKGKVEELVKISLSDCQLIDNYMTKYSIYEHSQSLELPVEVPPPEEIEEDIEAVLTWHEEFSNRSSKTLV